MLIRIRCSNCMACSTPNTMLCARRFDGDLRIRYHSQLRLLLKYGYVFVWVCARVHMLQLELTGSILNARRSSKLNVWSALLGAFVHTEWRFYDDINAGHWVRFGSSSSRWFAIFNVISCKWFIRCDLCVINIENRWNDMERRRGRGTNENICVDSYWLVVVASDKSEWPSLVILNVRNGRCRPCFPINTFAPNVTITCDSDHH